MTERLKPPSGPWKKENDQFGAKFVQNGPIDPTTSIVRSWEKQLLGDAQALTQFDKSPDGLKERWIMETTGGINDGHVGWCLRDDGDQKRYIMYNESNGTTGLVTSTTELKEAQRPAFLNLAKAETTLNRGGTPATVCFYFDSKPTYNETALAEAPLEDSIRELADLFKDSKDGASPYTTLDSGDTPEQLRQAHLMVVGSLVKGKLIRWSDEDKAGIDEDMAVIPEIVAEYAGDRLTQAQAQGMVNFLSAEILRALPENYPTLQGDERDMVLGEALSDAVLQSFKLHDASLGEISKHTLAFMPDVDQEAFVFMVLKGHRPGLNATDPSTGAANLLDANVGTVSSVYPYKDKEVACLKLDDYLAFLIKSKFNLKEALLYLAPRKADMDALMLSIKTDDISDWLKAFDEADTHLKVIPHPSLEEQTTQTEATY